MKLTRLLLLSAMTVRMCAGTECAPNKWQKVKDCAAQAEKWQAANPPLPGFSGSYAHHYNAQYDACYVQWTITHHGEGNSSADVYLFDAFEDKGLAATFTWGRYKDGAAGLSSAGANGEIGGRLTDWDAADHFIAGRMEN